jgi:hypothetical protein
LLRDLEHSRGGRLRNRNAAAINPRGLTQAHFFEEIERIDYKIEWIQF